LKLRDQLAAAAQKLGSRTLDADHARLEAEILLAHALDAPRSFLYAHDDLELPRQQRRAFLRLVKRRARGEPIAYITGKREFWSLPLQVSPEVLIPRAETERLVEAALEWIPQDQPTRIADLGTGSGAVALALASERPQAEIHATDINPEAVALARANAEALGFVWVQFHTGSWCEPLTETFDILVSNPPYVAGDDPHLQLGDCRFEPRIALTAGGDGLEAIREIVRQAKGALRAGGGLLLEHGPEQRDAVHDILQACGFGRCETLQDLEGRDRVTRCRMPD